MRNLQSGKTRRIGDPGEAQPDEQRAPLLGRWRHWYYFTAGSLLFYIVALTLFSRWFS